MLEKNKFEQIFAAERSNAYELEEGIRTMPQVSLEREIRALKLEVVRLKALVHLRNEEVGAAEGNVRESRESSKLLRSEVKRMEICLKDQGEKWREELEDNLRLARETTHASCELLRSKMERDRESSASRSERKCGRKSKYKPRRRVGSKSTRGRWRT